MQGCLEGLEWARSLSVLRVSVINFPEGKSVFLQRNQQLFLLLKSLQGLQGAVSPRQSF